MPSFASTKSVKSWSHSSIPFKKVDVLVNNAGLVIGVDKILDLKADDFDTMVNTNVKGLLYKTQAVLPGRVRVLNFKDILID